MVVCDVTEESKDVISNLEDANVVTTLQNMYI